MCDLYGWNSVRVRVLTEITVCHLDFPTKSYDQIDESSPSDYLVLLYLLFLYFDLGCKWKR